MAISLRSTSSLEQGRVKILVYGESGAGKTRLIPSLPSPVALSAEGGLLSIKNADVQFIDIESLSDLREAHRWLTSSKEAEIFQSVALDSISEIAEVVLSSEKKATKDGRAAYGSMQDQMSDIIRAFRDLPNKHVYFTAKVEKTQDEMGRMLHTPSMPGKKTSQALPYFFDEILALRVERDADGNTQRALMCDGDGVWLAKDRSGKLDAWESPDLGAIITKIGGVQ